MKGVQAWLQNALKATPLKKSNKVLIILIIFWLLEVLFLYIPDQYERLVSIIVVLQYLLLFIAAYRTKKVEQELFYPFIPYYLYILGTQIAAFYMDVSIAKAIDYIVYLACMLYFFVIAIKLKL